MTEQTLSQIQNRYQQLLKYCRQTEFVIKSTRCVGFVEENEMNFTGDLGYRRIAGDFFSFLHRSDFDSNRTA